MIERKTATKVRIKDLVKGEFIKTEDDMEPNYVVTPLNEMISRTRVMGVVVSKFTSEDDKYVNVTLDDSSEIISVRAFRDTDVLKGIEVGENIDVVGKVKKYQGEIYIFPEVVHIIEDLNWELVRRLELVIKDKTLGKKPSSKAVEDKVEFEGEAPPRDRVLEVIKTGDEGEGVKYITVVKETGIKEEDLDKIINDLLVEGEIYEPKIGRFKIMND
ncbi:MAG TPA: hypothetical protein ENH28_03155 [Euryarchaeota archaeon]|nr:OB-fold nucleic acid binding domain protein [archaeon BMS3Bbin15]HDL15140.1 hypothetical protein [Euryarchaeota archaeon]